MISVKDNGDNIEVRIEGTVLDLTHEFYHLVDEMTKSGVPIDLLRKVVELAAKSPEQKVKELLEEMPIVYKKASEGNKQAQELVKNFFELISTITDDANEGEKKS